MSVRVMSWVWEHSRAEGTDRLVLLAIADCASDDGGNAWPSVDTLAAKAKVSERTVQRSIRSLRLLGEVDVVEGGGRNRTNIYTVKMTPRQDDTPDNLTPVNMSPRQSDRVTSEAETVTPVTQNGDTGDTRTVLNRPNRPKNIRPNNDELTSTSDPRFVEFWSTYPRREAKPNALKALAKALKRAPLEKIIAGAAKYRDDPNRDPAYTAHAATWLNRDGWDDPRLPSKNTKPERVGLVREW